MDIQKVHEMQSLTHIFFTILIIFKLKSLYIFTVIPEPEKHMFEAYLIQVGRLKLCLT